MGLNYRNPGPSNGLSVDSVNKLTFPMSRKEANRLLNGLLDGIDAPFYRISAALVATGDLERCDELGLCPGFPNCEECPNGQ